MPTNLYGPGDNFNLETSHVLPALIRKFQEAKTSDELRVTSDKKIVTIWGTGQPRREFLHVDDLADACVFLMKNHDGSEIINVGAGKDITIRDLADLVRDIVGFKGPVQYDASKPDGTPRKLLDVSRLSSMGWQPRISLREGIEMTYRWYVKEKSL
jgi:GDP-L-fucose synthase